MNALILQNKNYDVKSDYQMFKGEKMKKTIRTAALISIAIGFFLIWRNFRHFHFQILTINLIINPGTIFVAIGFIFILILFFKRKAAE